FAGADAHRLFDAEDEDLPVADLSGSGRRGDRLDDLVDQLVANSDLDLDLGEEGDGVFRATIDFRMPPLAPVALYFGYRESLDADGGERFAHLVELERLDDCHHDFHQ